MESLLGFHVGIWDYVTFGAIFIIVAAGLAVAVFVLGLPGRIAVARKHPEAEAVYLTGGKHGAWAALRRISIRAHSWFNWLHPINF